MRTNVRKLPRGQVELTVELTPAEYEPFLRRAAEAISEEITIPGFRPGKATLEVVRSRVGEAKLWEAALEPAVKKTLVQAVNEAQLLTVGSPRIEVQTLAAGTPVTYRATLSLLPSVQLPDLAKVAKVAPKPVEVPETRVDELINELRKIRRSEALVARPATTQDKVTLDLTMSLDRVPLERGSQRNLELDLSEDRYLPGFAQQLVGLAAGQTKQFPLTFPDRYHDRALAGKTVEVTVAVQGVYELTTPPADDAWANNVGGFASLDDLRAKLRDNLRTEGELAERQRQEEAITESLINASKFGDLPDLLITTEINTMLQELERNVAGQGLAFDDYLRQIGKDRASLKLDFTPAAAKRIKGALITRAVAQRQAIAPTPEEITQTLEETRRQYRGDELALAQLESPDALAYLRNRIVARKVMEYLRSVLVKS